MISIFQRMGKSISKAGEILTRIGPTPSKQFKNAILDEDEEKAINLYTNVEGTLMTELHPSQPFPSKKVNNVTDTPLHLAAKCGLMKLALLLLQHGGDPSAVNSRQETCLHSVCSQSGSPAVRSMLLDELVRWEGVPASYGSEEPARPPMEKVSVNHIDIDGNAAIHYAAASGLVSCVEKLILLGAIISIVNKANNTCCEMADEKGHKSLALMLEMALVFQPVDESMKAFDAFTSFQYDNVPGKVMLNSCSLTLGGVNDFIEDAVRHVGNIVGGDLATFRNRTEALLEAVSWDAEALVTQYIEDPAKILALARLEPIKPAAVGVVSEDEKEGEKSVDGANSDTAATAISVPISSMPPHKDVTTSSEVCTICGDNMLLPVDPVYFVKGEVLEPDRRELRCLSGHAYCVSCWASHLHVQVTDKSLGCMPCPGFKCGEILDLQWAPVMLKTQELVNRLLSNRQRHVIDVSGLKTCPVETCGLVVCIPCQQPVTTVSSTGVSSRNAPKPVDHDVPLAVVCGNGHSFCLSCSQSAHSPLSCANFPVWAQQVNEETKDTNLKEGSSGDDIANALWVVANTKRCPRCSTPIEKDEGCNHMCCRKCRKEFCWICMQDWSQHSDNTGGYFQCNRFKDTVNKDGEIDVFAEEKGSALAETIRLRNKGARMARFIHYFTRFQAHGDSVKMEGRMQKETLPRIAEGLKASRDGQLQWLQQGNGVVNPLLAPAAKSPRHDEAARHQKSDSNGNSVANSRSGTASPATEVMVTRHDFNENNRKAAAAALSRVSFEAHSVKTEECLNFLLDGFQELLKCRDILQWSYPYAYFEFEDRSTNDYGGVMFVPMTRYARAQQHHHRTSFELLQSDLESMVETLSDVVARRRLRAGLSQIALVTRAARSKRIELESLLIAYNMSKNQPPVSSGGNSSYNTPNRSDRQRRSDGSRRSGSRSSRRLVREDSSDSIDMASLLLEIELANREELTLEERVNGRAPQTEEQAALSRQRAQEILAARISEMLNDTRAAGDMGVFDFRPANLFNPQPPQTNTPATASEVLLSGANIGTPPPPPSSRRRSHTGSGSTSRRRRHSSRDRHDDRQPRDIVNANNSPMSQQLHSSAARPPRPPSQHSNSPALSPAQRSNQSAQELSSAAGDDSSLLGGDNDGDEDNDADEMNRVISNLNPATPEAGERVARSVASEMRLARLTQRAEEEAALNRAILMSLQDPRDRLASEGPSVQSEADVETLMNMGFERESAMQALREARNNVEMAANRLLGNE